MLGDHYFSKSEVGGPAFHYFEASGTLITLNLRLGEHYVTKSETRGTLISLTLRSGDNYFSESEVGGPQFR